MQHACLHHLICCWLEGIGVSWRRVTQSPTLSKQQGQGSSAFGGLQRLHSCDDLPHITGWYQDRVCSMLRWWLHFCGSFAETAGCTHRLRLERAAHSTHQGISKRINLPRKPYG
jgi:hypothetical protein